MIEQIVQSHGGCRDFSSFEVSMRSGGGRLYLATPTFCIDLNVLHVRGTTSMDRLGMSLPGDSRFLNERFSGFGIASRINLECEIGAMSLVTEIKQNRRELMPGVIDMRGLDNACGFDNARVYCISPERQPPMPNLPIWLPGGVWNCEYCGTAQLSDLIQCRNCGAPRYGEVK